MTRAAPQSGNHDANLHSPQLQPRQPSAPPRHIFLHFISSLFGTCCEMLMSLHASRHVYFNIISPVVQILLLLANCADKLALTDRGTLPSCVSVWPFWTEAVYVCERERDRKKSGPTLRGTEAVGFEPRLSITAGLNIEVVTPDDSTILDFPVYLRWRGITGGVCLPLANRGEKTSEPSALKDSSIFSPLQRRKANTRNKTPIQHPALTLLAKHT